ncbi:acyl-CoA thioesterase [Deinococcus fonticola]|uniref:acyl-CoA thioesterase n=1 Tax=Deinococcus fonticola TaxID=2528713 RepID=UPI001F0CE92F|nr:thioesterase family protein [Deinococcus fonticola]
MNLSLPGDPVDWNTLPTQQRYKIQLPVQPADLDDLNHVNNTVYLAWCEQVARQHALSVGLGTPALAALGAVPVAREHLIRYLKPALLGDLVRVRTALVFSGGLRSTRVYSIDRLNPAAEKPVRLAECRTDWVWVDPASGRPRRIPDEVLRRFGFST